MNNDLPIFMQRPLRNTDVLNRFETKIASQHDMVEDILNNSQSVEFIASDSSRCLKFYTACDQYLLTDGAYLKWLTPPNEMVGNSQFCTYLFVNRLLGKAEDLRGKPISEISYDTLAYHNLNSVGVMIS